jgi:hypothetical protein
VPARVAEVPWGAGALSLRALTFTSVDKLPWQLLALYNVKYATDLSAELMTNSVRLPDGSQREITPGDLRIHTNPLAITPRVFFARSVLPVAGAKEAANLLFAKAEGGEPYDAVGQSVVEGFPEKAAYPAIGRVESRFADDVVSLRFEPHTAPRFLVVNERFDRRWKAYAGEKELPVYATNLLMRGVVVPPGATEVIMRYTSPVASFWAMVSYAAAALLLLICMAAFRRLCRPAPN